MGIETSCKKGDFPYLLSNPRNHGKKWDSLPPLAYYAPIYMPEKRRREIEQWHRENRQQIFDFDLALREYCENDVKVLKLCVLKFRAVFLEITTDPEKALKGICPFYKSFTLASACNRVFRQLFLKPRSLALLHMEDEKLKMQNHSILAIKWLKYLNIAENLSPQIRHARNGGEVRVLGKPVDGYRESRDGEKTVYRFLGCFFHCHKTHVSLNRLHPLSKTNMGDIYNRTVARTQELRKAGYTVIEKWECDFNLELKKVPKIKDIVKKITVDEPLDPRHALCGGRTNAVKLYAKAKTGRCLRFLDIKSLYPFVNKTGKYMLHHPVIITENFCPLDRVHEHYKGLIKCVVLPPRDLYLPVLPAHIGGKLLFPLCWACADTKYCGRCEHTISERALHGTYCHIELVKAVSMGYKVLEVSAVWHYDEWVTGLFSGYISKFFQIKEEVSWFS